MKLTPGSDIQAAINARPSGTTFCLASGVYTPSSLSPKAGDRFVGPAVLDGRNSAAYAFNSAADGIVIDTLEIKNYISDQMDGAVHIDGSNWVVKNSYIHHNRSAGIVWDGDYNKILNNRLMSNGEEGFASSNDNYTLFSGNEVGWNNTSHQDWNDEAGGGKFYKSTNLTVVGNWAHDNDGPGLWCDTNCYNVVFERNKLTNNTAAGIDYEISYKAVIRNNTFSGNGTYRSSSAWYGSAAILVESSRDVEVYGNTSSRDGNGIVLLHESRGSGNRGAYGVANVYVHDNKISHPTKKASGLWNTTSDASVWSSKGNRFVSNDYVGPSGASCFTWNDNSLNWSGWRSAGQDTAGTYTTG